MEKEVLDAQNPHWEHTYAKHSEMFGQDGIDACCVAGLQA